MQRSRIAIILITLFLFGTGYIIWNGRAVNKIISNDAASTKTDNQYSLADVTIHAADSDCWTVIDGSVYELTSWIYRHPGGAKPIIAMCGQDSTVSFTNQHGGSKAAKAALVLLKIGQIQ